MTDIDLTPILGPAGAAIYIALGLIALYGMFCVILLVRRIAQKQFANDAAAGQFLDEVSKQVKQKNFDAVTEMCDTPAYWSKAVPQLILLALTNRKFGPAKLRRMLGEAFERDVLSDLEYRTSWVATVVKSAPMLGLLGTVIGMINAFAKIGAAQESGLDPKLLAEDISLALFTTALGLTVAIPLVLAGNMISVRIGKLQDSVQQYLGRFVDDLSEATAESGGPPS